MVLLASGSPSVRVSVREAADERAMRLLTPPLDGMLLYGFILNGQC